MKILAIHSIKGGVGKTSTAVNLAWVAAEQGAKVLLWDLDPQAAATWTLRVRADGRIGSRRLVQRRRPLHEMVMASDHPRVDLLPARLALRKLDRRLSEVRHRRDRLARRAAELAPRYDLLVFDCPPGVSLLHENVFAASDALAVPLIPAPLSVRTLDQLAGFLEAHDRGDLVLLPFFSMVDRRKRLHRDTTETLRAQIGDVMRSDVPIATAVERMGVHRAPVGAFAPRSAAARAYRDLYAEIASFLWSARGGLTARDLHRRARNASGAGSIDPAP